MHAKPGRSCVRSGPGRVGTAALCLWRPPAHATIAADFNGDGVLDAVVLRPRNDIIVRLSGSAPQILKLSGRIISVVASDIDHDGHLDLSALSEHEGLHVWLNKAGHGRFAALQKHRAPRAFGFSRAARAAATEQGHSDPRQSRQIAGCRCPRAGPVFEAPRGGHTVPTLLFTSLTDLGKSTAPRGPPSSTLD